MDLRNIIVILGLVAIIVIVWDGLRRMKTGATVKPKKKSEKKTEDDDWVDPEEVARKAEIARELPNGGARRREMTEKEQTELATRLNLRERVPMLMERVDVEVPAVVEDEIDTSVQSELDFTATLAGAEEQVTRQQPPQKNENPYSTANLDAADGRIEPSFGFDTEPEDVDAAVPMPISAEAPQHRSPVADGYEITGQPMAKTPTNYDADIDSEAETELKNETNNGVKRDHEESSSDVQQSAQSHAASENATKASKQVSPGPVEDLVVIHVMARNDGELSGSAVLELLLAAGLRHGPMDIFHYRNPKGYTEFSLANCVQPGTFDPDSMNQVNTPGVTVFMQLPTAADAMESFEHMYEMARFLATHLDAEILDEDHSSVTKQRLAYYREKLSTFARSKLIPS